MRAVLDAAAAITALASLDVALLAVLDAAVTALDGTGGALLRLDSAGLRTLVSIGPDPRLGGADPDTSPAYAAVRSGEVVVHIEPDDTAIVAVPIVAGGDELLGVLVVHTPHGRVLPVEMTYAAEICGYLAATAMTQGALVAAAESQTMQLEHAAFHDMLTGVGNRLVLAQWVDDALARTRAGHGLTGVLLLDLDGLTAVNQQYGHVVGDELLTAFVARLRGCLRPEDKLARIDGDSFAVVLSDLANGAVATVVAERILGVVNCTYALMSGRVLQTSTVGITVAGVHDALSWEVLLRRATLALDDAKRRCRAGYRVYDPSLVDTVAQRRELEASLETALELGELVLRYQPVVDLAEGRVTGAEALVRWAHPDQGLLGPDTFIPTAVESGSIVAIGRMVLRSACGELARWQSAYGVHAPPWISVNVAARQLESGSLVEDVEQALAAAGLPGSALVLELTEDAVVSSDPMVASTLAHLRRTGVGIAIDDFGSRYSALGYLVRLPVDVIKVDKSFIDGLGSSVESSVVVGAVVDLARQLGLRAIAEGVEDKEQAAELLALGCAEAQGFWFARPLTGEEVGAVLARGATPMSALIPSPRSVPRRAEAS